MIENLSPHIRIKSHNPYESRYPERRVISRETLDFVKRLRESGYSVAVDPEDGSELTYATQKGLREFLADPIIMLVVGIPISVMVNLLSTWLYEKFKRLPNDEDINIILEVDENGERIRYNHKGNQISEKKFKSVLKLMERRVQEYEKSQALVPPDPTRPVPIFLEHTDKLIGWGQVLTDEVGLKLKSVEIIDKKTSKRVAKGTLEGISIAGLIDNSTCTICEGKYVECNHIGGKEYEGEECAIRVDGILLTEISFVKKPVQPLARIERSTKARKKKRRK
jgi:hypothetical protein